MRHVRGRVALVLTSPPYGASVHGHVTAVPGRSVAKHHDHYSEPGRHRGNLAHAGDSRLLDGFAEILAAAEHRRDR